MEKTNYFRPNWSQINKALSDPNLRKEMREQLHKLKKKVDDKCTEQFRQTVLAEKQAKINAIKTLPIGATVYFINSDRDLLGREGVIVKHKRTRVLVNFKHDDPKIAGKWDVMYRSLSIEPMSSSDLSAKKAVLRITERLNGVL